VGAVFAGFPVFWMAASSFKANSEIFELPPRIITQNFSFDAYSTILTDPVLFSRIGLGLGLMTGRTVSASAPGG